MTRTVFNIVWLSVMACSICSTAQAQNRPAPGSPRSIHPLNAKPIPSVRQSTRFASQRGSRSIRPVSRVAEPSNSNETTASTNPVPVVSVPHGYVQLNAPIYPSPVQHVPPEIGGTLITNPAFAPHEMLYTHKYKAMYPPFYFKVRGSWVWTPWGIRSHDVWKLRGTEVSIQYKKKYPWRQPFTPPVIR
ncbi:MAG: hypothetical protein ACKVT0_13465 [Planctomycetaceae bacterium]